MVCYLKFYEEKIEVPNRFIKLLLWGYIRLIGKERLRNSGLL